MTNYDTFLDLFIHRDDCFAEQQPDGAYFPVLRPFTKDELDEHLAGQASYGTYVINPDGETVKYVVFDLDTHDDKAWEDLQRLVEQLVRSVGGDPRCLLAESSGRKGKHIWLFLSAPLPAAAVRRWVARDFTPAWLALGHPMLEVFPKQDTVGAGGYGNLVKLPLGVHRVSGGRSEILGRHGWAATVDSVQPLPASSVPEVAPAASAAAQGSSGGRSAPAGDGPATPFPCVTQILRSGAGEGNRDNAIFHLALYLYGHGFDEDLALEQALRANEHFDPPLTEREVRTKVASAYKGRFESAKCGTGWLQDFCEGPCRNGWRVKQTATGVLASAQEGDLVEVEVVRRNYAAGRSRVTVTHPDAENQPTFICG